MRTRNVTIGSLCLLVLGAGSAAAQDAPKAGITMGFPGSIGVLWQVSERVAVRPELSFSLFSSSTASTLAALDDDQNDSWAFGTGVSVLFTVHKSDNLRTYVAPRFSYSRTSIDTGDTTESAGNDYSAAGMFGAEYSLSRRFSVFGEVGADYSWQKSTHTFSGLPTSAPATTFTAKSHTLSTRTGVGVILYF